MTDDVPNAAAAWLDEADRLGYAVMGYRTREGEKGIGIAPPDKEPADPIMLAFFTEMRRIGYPAIYDALVRQMVAAAGGGQ